MYLDTGEKHECFGCEACVQVCEKDAVRMVEDEEGFRYPVIDTDRCIGCGLCRHVCPYGNTMQNTVQKYVWGGYHLDPGVRFDSTSGGAFSAIAETFCDENYAVFGAEAKGLLVFHSYITDIREVHRFQKSKYSQSNIGHSYRQCKEFLKEGKKVLFSGTPCQIAGLKKYLGNCDQERLLTVEVICEGVPSPLYMQKYECHLKNKYGCGIDAIDYRYTGKSLFASGRWDFEAEKTDISERRDETGRREQGDVQYADKRVRKKTIKRDRWVNPFWSIWLDHLMSRPSCYQCQFTTTDRVADITLGDLWGVHLYCPELYGRNGGASLVVCNTENGKDLFKKASKMMYGHELNLEEALKYQGPMYKHISENPMRGEFMHDLEGAMDYQSLNKKWAKRPTIRLLISKYIWGNRQKVAWWNIRNPKKKGSGA